MISIKLLCFWHQCLSLKDFYQNLKISARTLAYLPFGEDFILPLFVIHCGVSCETLTLN